MSGKPDYASIKQLMKDWPIHDYIEEELGKISQEAKKRGEELMIRLWGNEYAKFRPDGGIDTLEIDNIKKDGTLEMPPRNDKGVVYKFKMMTDDLVIFPELEVKERIII